MYFYYPHKEKIWFKSTMVSLKTHLLPKYNYGNKNKPHTPFDLHRIVFVPIDFLTYTFEKLTTLTLYYSTITDLNF